ncbi:hypothetical protein [Staphylococcus sp. 11261D007BR]
MKKFLWVLIASAIVLAACGNGEDTERENKNNKTEQKNKNKETAHEKSTEEQATEETEQEQQVNLEKHTQIDLSNITDTATLESVLYGNYTEEQKIQAYNSAVANGIIPQGNVMEGSALSAYKSSLRIASGQEESVYNNKGTDAGMIDYEEYNRIVEEEQKAKGSRTRKRIFRTVR